MDTRTLVETMLSTGKRYSMDTKNLGVLAIRICVLSLKFIDKAKLWKLRFNEDYVHWDLVNSQPMKNILGDCAAWLALLGVCKWDSLVKQEGVIAARFTPLQTLRRNMRECNLDTGDEDAWTFVIKFQLLLLIQGLSSLHAVEVLSCQMFKRNTHDGCMQLLAKQADSLFSPDEYLATLDFIFQHCEVNKKLLDENLALLQASREDVQKCLQMSRMVVIQGRPRLRDRVSSVLQTSERKVQVDVSLNTWESYTGFCYKHQFPTTLSEKIKSRLYFLASQTRWYACIFLYMPMFSSMFTYFCFYRNSTAHLGKVLVSAAPLLAKVAAHPITQPDVHVLIRVINDLSMDGRAPFPQMTEFRLRCFQSFPVIHVQRMTLTQILQLYVAAYQPTGVWKEIWKDRIGVISVQIIKDCEVFVSKFPFAEESVMQLMCS